MLDGTQALDEAAFVFGPFEFHPTRRVLLRAGKRLSIGSRACEILLALLENAGTLVKKSALFNRVWADTIVEEGTLRVHMTKLRKLLSEGHNKPSYIENVHGLGYRFSATVTRASQRPHGNPAGISIKDTAGVPIRFVDLDLITNGSLIAAALACRSLACRSLAANDPKTLVGARTVRRQVTAGGRGAAEGGADPTATAPDTHGAAAISPGMGGSSLQAVVPTPTSLPHVCRHVIEPQLVGLLATDGLGLIMIQLDGGPAPRAWNRSR